MREKRRLLTTLLTIIVFSFCFIPSIKAKADENIIEMYPGDETENPGCQVLYNLNTNEVTAIISSNDGMLEWIGTSNTQSVASRFGMKFTSLTIGKDVTYIDNRAFSQLKKQLGALIIDEENTRFKIQDNMVINATGDTVLALLDGYMEGDESSFDEITLPDTITSIGSHAFDGNKKFKLLNAPKVTEIGNYAFQDCAITKFTCENIAVIGDDAFQNCEKLEEFLTDTDDGVTLVSSAFYGCKKLKSFAYKLNNTVIPMNVFMRCEVLESFTLADNITKIESLAFNHCKSITEMTIPESVKIIGSSAFDDCQSLKTVTFVSATPPSFGDHVFTSCPADLRLIVPVGSEEAYVEALGTDYYDNIYETGMIKYPVYINGLQFTNSRMTIQCGDGTAVYNPDTETLTLNNVTVNDSTIVKQYGWLHGGSIYSGVDDLTIIVNGNNYMSADADGISTVSGANVTIKGTGKLVLDTLAISDFQMASMYIGLGDDPTGIDGGDLVIDGPEIVASRELQANRNLIFKGGSKVVTEGRLRSNNNGDIRILDDADVTAGCIDSGLPATFDDVEVYQRDMHLVIDGGKLKLTGWERNLGETTWSINGIFFDNDAGTAVDSERDPRGYVEITNGVLIIDKPALEGKLFTNCPDDHITIGSDFVLEDGTDLTVEKIQQGALSASSHKFGPWEKLDDKYHKRDCSGTGKHVAHSDQAEHSWSDGVITKEATVEDEGERTYTCKYCKATKVEKIDKLPAPPTPTPTKEVTPTPAPMPATPTGDPSEGPTPTGVPTDSSASTPTPTAVPTASTPTTTPAVTPTPDPEKQMGEDGTPYGEGASYEAVDKAITTMTSDDDPAGTVYHVLQAKATKLTKNSVKITWKKPKGAVKFYIYANKCGKKNKLTQIASISGTSYNLKTINGKKLSKSTYYKLMVVAVDKDNKVVSTSRVVHAATKGGKAGNPKSITVKKTKVSVKAKKTFKLKGKQKNEKKYKKHRVLRYESTDTSIATVSSKGVIKGKKKGKCEVYAFAQNGLAKKISVTVK